MSVVKSPLLFALAALAEIGGAWLIWQGVREHKGWIWIGAGVVALGLYGFARPDLTTTLPPDDDSGNARNIAAMRKAFNLR